MNNPGQDFEALICTIQSIYDLKGIGVEAVYVCEDLWKWMEEMERRRKRNVGYWVKGEQYYNEAAPVWHSISLLSIQPYGAYTCIPIMVKNTGEHPWEVVTAYIEEDEKE